MYVSVREALAKGSGSVALRGWCYRERTLKENRFIVLRDSTGIIQCVAKKGTVSEDVWKTAEEVLIEESLEVKGSLRRDERAPGGVELDVKDLKVIGRNAKPFPITKDQSTEFLLDVRHLWLRSRYMTSVLKVRSTVLTGFREFYLKQGYREWSPPILQPTQCEGGSTLFSVKYFDDTLYLTQSWQLYAEAGIYGLEKIFTISPCFRAERSKTTRHLAEFWMAEMESAWMDLDGLAKSAENCVSYIVKKVLEENFEELRYLKADIDGLKKVKPPFPRMTYTEALEFLKKHGLEVPWGKDLRTVEEDELSKHFDKPIIITHYPKEVMAFYKPRDPSNPEVALCMDVIAPKGYGEIIGGSQRDLDVEAMKEELRKDGEDPSKYEWYFDTRRYGVVPHAGYGLGVERLVAWICNLQSVKDAIPFPRTMTRYKP